MCKKSRKRKKKRTERKEGKKRRIRRRREREREREEDRTNGGSYLIINRANSVRRHDETELSNTVGIRIEPPQFTVILYDMSRATYCRFSIRSIADTVGRRLLVLRARLTATAYLMLF